MNRNVPHDIEQAHSLPIRFPLGRPASVTEGAEEYGRIPLRQDGFFQVFVLSVSNPMLKGLVYILLQHPVFLICLLDGRISL